MENIHIFGLFEYADIQIYLHTLRVFFQFPNIRFRMQKNPNGQLYSKSIHKYFLSIRILGRRTASAEATSVPLSSLSVLPSPLAGWIVRDKGEHHSDNYHGSCPSKFTMSTLCTLSLCCRVQVLARRVIYEHTSNVSQTSVRFGSGECFGWSCKCQSNKDATLAPEFEDIATNEE